MGIVVLLLVGFQIMKWNTKKYSPEDTVEYSENGMDIKVKYCRPFKNGREIFGDLVPYGKVWRTGANEATTFTTQTDLDIMGQTLPKGKYTLWTIPGKRKWDVIFNKGQYGWGVNWDGEASRDPELDVVNVSLGIQRSIKVYEQFTIEVDGDPLKMRLGWDVVRVDVPLKKAE